MFTRHRRPDTDPALDERVLSVLAAAAAPTEPGPLPGETEALAAFRASRHATRRPAMLSSLMTAKAAAAAALSAGLLLTGSVGAAAAGVLPDGAQDSASELLAKVGVTVPDSHGRSGEHADGREAAENGDRTTDANAKGKSVSELAKSDELTGRDKGEAVSRLASGDKSHAGEHGREDSTSDHAAAGDTAGTKGEAGEHQPSNTTHGDVAEDAKADTDVADQKDPAGTDGTDGAEQAGASAGGAGGR